MNADTVRALQQVLGAASPADRKLLARKQPTAVQDLFLAVADMSEEDIQKTMDAGKNIAKAMSSLEGNSLGDQLSASGLEEAVAQIHKTFVNLPKGAQESLISQAPGAGKSVLAVAREMQPEHVQSIARDVPVLMKAAHKMADGPLHKSLQGIDKHAVGRLHAHYKNLSPGARKVFYTQLPQESQPFAKAMTHMTTQECVNIVGQLPELAQAMEVVSGQDQDAPTTDASVGEAKRLKAAKVLFRAFQAVPPGAREDLAQMLPKEAQGLVEMAEGLSEDDVGVLVEAMDNKAKPPARSNANEADDEGDERKRAVRQAFKGAKMVARAETRRLWQWVRAGPCHLRVLTFLSGLALVTSGAIGMLIQTFNGFRIFAIGICFYLAVIGIGISSLEIKSAVCNTYVRSQVYKYFHFLSLMRLRGPVLMFLGVTSFSIIYRATKGWTELFNTGAGLLCFTVGVFTLISGIVAERKLKMARAHVDSEQQMRDAFNLIDEYGEGKLPSEKIYDLLAHFDPPTVLTDGELAAAMNLMDKDANGFVEIEEFIQWYHGSNLSTEKAIQKTDYGAVTENSTVATKPANKEPCGYHVFKGTTSLLAIGGLALLLLGSLLGFINEWGSPNFDLLTVNRIFVDVSIFSLSLFSLLVELHVTLKSVNVLSVVDKEFKFLSRMWGRGVFYMFISTLAMTSFDASETLNDIGGFITLFVGVFLLVIGGCTEKKLLGRGELTYEDAVAAFEHADADSNGTVDTTEFPALIKRLNIGKLNRLQLEAAFMSMDIDGDGGISKAEFLEWSQGKENLPLAGNNGSARQGEQYQPLESPLLGENAA